MVYVAMAIPYLGGVVRFLTLLTGLGAIAGRLWVRFRT